MIQPEFETLFRKDHPLKGHWHENFFGNEHPIVLELGCGRGEYTVGLAAKHPDVNYIGIDIKGARMWRGAKTASEQKMDNVAFLRIRIEFIDSFFAPEEVDQIWITFPDPQMSKRRVNKRLTSPGFLERYARFLRPDGLIHLKTDSGHLHAYTQAVLAANGITPNACCGNLYGNKVTDAELSIKTAYETRFMADGIPITYLQWSLGGKQIFTAPEFPADELLVGEHLPVR